MESFALNLQHESDAGTEQSVSQTLVFTDPEDVEYRYRLFKAETRISDAWLIVLPVFQLWTTQQPNLASAIDICGIRSVKYRTFKLQCHQLRHFLRISMTACQLSLMRYSTALDWLSTWERVLRYVILAERTFAENDYNKRKVKYEKNAIQLCHRYAKHLIGALKEKSNTYRKEYRQVIHAPRTRGITTTPITAPQPVS